MIIRKVIYSIVLFSIYIVDITAFGQEKIEPDSISNPYKAQFGVATVITSGNAVPFWMRSQQYGAVPLEGLSVVLDANVKKDFSKTNSFQLDWGGGLDIRLNAGSGSNLQIIEAYLKGKFSIFQLKVGRSRDMYGLVDSALSSGSFSLSGNALGIPKVELSLPHYNYLPFLKNLIGIRGDISYGSMGHVPIQYGDNKGDRVSSFYHHLSVVGKLGKPNWKIRFEGAINHDVIWGSDKLIFGDQYTLSNIEALFYVTTGKKFHGARDISKIGNHLGSIDLASDYEFRSFNLRLYHQFLYDKGALVYLANIKDGLTGISVSNRAKDMSKSNWSKILFEFLYTKDQASQLGAKSTPSGSEYYFNHAVYSEGFSYKGLGLGMPLITPNNFAKAGQASDPSNFFINNRIIAFHLGVVGNVNKWDITFKSTFSKNFGDYKTGGPVERWFNGKRVKQIFSYGKFKPVKQFSGVIKVARPIKNGYYFSAAIANDSGGLLNNSTGGMLTLTKNW